MEPSRIDCFKCRNFYITWDRKFPYGCRGLHFKSKAIPSREVKAASGTDCLMFERKPDVRK
ncbi:MAG: uracil-DNA glycosylase [Nitrospirae bacterium YQR-1]